jgi:steroid delta-isomerase-like uncharacterized protein
MKNYLAFLMLLMPLISKAQHMNNKEIISALYEQSLNKRNFSLLKDFISSDYPGGVAGFESNIIPLINAFPDVHWEIKELIAEENKVVIRWKLTGTHTGQFRNIAATGRKVTNTAMAIYEFKNGKIINTEVLTDRLGFLQELGVLPADPK